MNDYENTGKAVHPALGVVLGLLGIFTVLTMTFFAGAIASAAAVLLGAGAILLGIGARKAGKGIGAIFTGGLAILMALILLISVVGTLRSLQEKAERSGRAPLVSQYLVNPYLGLVGIYANLPKEEGIVDELMNEIDILNGITEESPSASGTGS